jgi:O-antigen ligase
MTKKKFKNIFILIIIINIILLYFRISNPNPEFFKGNIFSVVSFLMIFLLLLYFFIKKEYEYFILIWISFHWAVPLIKIPGIPIGSLGLLNGFFMPLMIMKLINFKNKYFLLILFLIFYSLINFSNVGLRMVLSSIFELIAPILFVYFIYKKCKNKKLLLSGIIIVSLLTVPLSFYQVIVHPEGGYFEDWRGPRIYGNMYWPNSYSIFLLAPILALYLFQRDKHSKMKLLFLSSLLIVNFFTLSRIGILSLFTGIFIFEFFYNKKSNKIYYIDLKRIFLIVIVILFLISYLLYTHQLDQHLTVGSINERTELWDSIIPLVEDNLIVGNGLGSYELYQDKIYGKLSPHNYYLGILFELGIIGLIIIIIFVSFVINDLLNQIKRKNLFKSAELGLALLIPLLMISFVGSGFSQISALNAWIMLGCCLIYDGKDANKKQIIKNEKD